MYCYSMTTDAIYEECRSDWSHQVSAGAMMVAAWSDPSSLRRVWLVRLGWGQEILAVLSCVLQGHWDNQQQSSNVLQTPLLVLNPFIFMHQVKKFGAEILFIPYFSSSGPPSHSPCLVVSAVTITFLLEPPVRNESSSSGPPSGNTNQFSINSSQNPSLQLWYWQVVPGCSFLYVHTVSEKASFTWKRQQLSTPETKTQRVHKQLKVAILLNFRSLHYFRSANKIGNFCVWAERLSRKTRNSQLLDPRN